ncbi:MAG: cell division protein, partial [Microbacterium sp.]
SAAPAPITEVPDGGQGAAAPAAASAGIIELAQRLHDEHVAEGRAQRDQLISDAKSQAAAILSEAETRGREEVAKLDRERAQLESRISELRNFERDYRAQLRSYIEGKLRDLETTATTSGATPVSAIGL